MYVAKARSQNCSKLNKGHSEVGFGIMSAQEWPARPYIFAVLGAVSASLVYLLIDNLKPPDDNFNLRVAAAVGITAFSSVFCVAAHRQTLFKCLLYAIVVALVVGSICYWRLYIQWPEAFCFTALALSVFIITPFFQSALHSSFRDYKALHHHAWGNLLIGILSVLFMGLSLALAHLLGTLFSLVGIDFIKNLLREEFTVWLLCGTALGAAVGVLREHDKIISSTQSVVQSIFSLLVLPLALGLGGFIIALPFTGLDTLWSSTRNTSATLFSCAAIALIVINAVVRDNSTSQSKSRIALISARVLSVTIAPMALVAVVAIKLRVEQYGWTPDRLWATVVCGLLVLYGVTYIFAGLTKAFPAVTRSVNMYLALVICAVALLLATPLFDFGEVSAHDQLNRYSEGTISEEKLDLTALAFDFGPAGRTALETLKTTASPTFAAKIDGVMNADYRWRADDLEEPEDVIEVKDRLVISPSSWVVPQELMQRLTKLKVCSNTSYCYLFASSNNSEVILIDQLCHGTRDEQCRPRLQVLQEHPGSWSVDTVSISNPEMNKDFAARGELLKQVDIAAIEGKLKLKPVQRMQLFVDDQPFGPTIE